MGRLVDKNSIKSYEDIYRMIGIFFGIFILKSSFFLFERLFTGDSRLNTHRAFPTLFSLP